MRIIGAIFMLLALVFFMRELQQAGKEGRSVSGGGPLRALRALTGRRPGDKQA